MLRAQRDNPTSDTALRSGPIASAHSGVWLGQYLTSSKRCAISLLPPNRRLQLCRAVSSGQGVAEYGAG